MCGFCLCHCSPFLFLFRRSSLRLRTLPSIARDPPWMCRDINQHVQRFVSAYERSLLVRGARGSSLFVQEITFKIPPNEKCGRLRVPKNRRFLNRQTRLLSRVMIVASWCAIVFYSCCTALTLPNGPEITSLKKTLAARFHVHSFNFLSFCTRLIFFCSIKVGLKIESWVVTLYWNVVLRVHEHQKS